MPFITDNQVIAFFMNQLSYLEKKIYEKQYAEITYPKILPVSTEAGEGATSVDYFYTDGAGVAKFIGPKSTDVPISDISMYKVTVPVELGGTAYEYSDEEIRQAIMLNRDLPSLKATMSRRAMEEHTQRVYMFGDTVHNLPGFLNNTNVTAGTVVDPGSGTEWVNKTPDEIVDDINTLFSDIFSNSLMRENADTLGLPPGQWAYIGSTRLGSVNDTTIMEYIVNKVVWLNSFEDIIPINELTGAGAGATDRMVAYTKDPDKVVAHMPMPLKYNEPLRKDVGWKVVGTYKISGVEFRYPGSAQYADGI